MGDEVRSMLQLLPTEARDAIILYFLGWDPSTGDSEQDEARRTRLVVPLTVTYIPPDPFLHSPPHCCCMSVIEADVSRHMCFERQQGA